MTRVVAEPPWRGRTLAGRLSSRAAEGAAEPDLAAAARCSGGGWVWGWVWGWSGSVAAGVGEGFEVGAQASGDGVGDAGVDLGGAVAAAAEGEAGQAAGAAFLVLEGAAFVVVGDVGGDDLEDLAAQDAQVSRVERGGLLDEVDLRATHDVGVEVVGEVVERAGDDPGLLEVDAAGQESGADPVPAVLEGFGDTGIGQGGAVAAAGVVGQPGGGAAGAGVIGHVVGGGKHPHPQAVQGGRRRGTARPGPPPSGSWSSAPGRRALPRPPPRAPARRMPAPGGGEAAGPGPCTHARPDRRHFRPGVRTLWTDGTPSPLWTEPGPP